MLNILSVSMRNFFSYGNNTTVINFNRVGTTLVTAENLDNTGINNGSGKTAGLIHALIFGLYDKIISDINKDHLVNNINKKHMEVSVTFEKSGWYYRVIRARKMKSGPTGNYVKFYKRLGDAEFTEEDEATPAGGSDKTNAAIEAALGIPYELFVRIVIFSATHISFLDLPPRHPTQYCQASFMENLLNMTLLTYYVELIKAKNRTDEATLEHLIRMIDMVKKEHEQHKKQVDSAHDRIATWDVQKSQNINKLESEMHTAQTIDYASQRELLNEMAQCKDAIKSITNENAVLSQKIKGHTSVVRDLAEQEKHLTDDLCPYCKRDYHAIDKLDEVRAELVKIRDELNVYVATLEENNTTIKELNTVSRLSQSNLKFKTMEELVAYESKADTFTQRIQDLADQSNPYIAVLNDLLEQELPMPDYTSVNDLKRQMDHQKFLQKLFADKDSFIRKTLLNKYIPFLNSRLQKYLQDLALPHSVQFTHQMEAEITQFGNPLGFGNLSNGQRARVNFALSLAFRDVLQKLHGKVNLCILDEVLDAGLDAAGVTASARILKRIARDERVSMFIISHREELSSSFDSVLKVQMDKGFSYILQD